MRILKITLKIIVMIAVFSLITMLLWNWLIPDIFKGPAITYLQAFGLLALGKILFAAPGRGGFGGRGRWRNREACKKQFEEKLNSMTPEEREKFKTKCTSKWH